MPLFLQFDKGLVLTFIVAAIICYTLLHIIFASFVVVIMIFYLATRLLNTKGIGRCLISATVFEASKTGQFHLNEKKYQLLPQSRVDFFGYTLVLELAEKNESINQSLKPLSSKTQKYLPKACLSPQDNARLSRIVIHYKNTIKHDPMKLRTTK